MKQQDEDDTETGEDEIMKQQRMRMAMEQQDEDDIMEQKRMTLTMKQQRVT